MRWDGLEPGGKRVDRGNWKIGVGGSLILTEMELVSSEMRSVLGRARAGEASARKERKRRRVRVVMWRLVRMVGGLAWWIVFEL